MTRKDYAMSRKHHKRKQGAWSWPWAILLVAILAVWATWFIASGAVRP